MYEYACRIRGPAYVECVSVDASVLVHLVTMSKPVQLQTPESLPTWALEALTADASLPICTACGTQYSKQQTGDCVICLDPRWVLD